MPNFSNLIDDDAGLLAVAEELSQHDIIAFDTEFIREKTFYPILEIIQVATGNDSWIIDAQAFMPQGRRSGIQPLLDVLLNPGILKIVHAAYGDQECLLSSFGCVAQPILDTAVAAALLGYGDSAGLRALLESELNVSMKKGHTRARWSIRPLPGHLVEYAHADVVDLVELGERLLNKLDKRGRRDWALSYSQEFEAHSLYDTTPEDIAKKLSKHGSVRSKHYPILLALARWREGRIRELNVPRKWLCDDGTLIQLSIARPKTMDELGTFRGIAKNEIARQGQELLRVIQDAASHEPMKTEKVNSPSQDESRAIDVLRFFIDIMASTHKVAPRFLIDPKQYLSLLREPTQTVEGLIEANILSQESAELIGERLMEFLHGNQAISIENGKVLIRDL